MTPPDSLSYLTTLRDQFITLICEYQIISSKHMSKKQMYAVELIHSHPPQTKTSMPTHAGIPRSPRLLSPTEDATWPSDLPPASQLCLAYHGTFTNTNAGNQPEHLPAAPHPPHLIILPPPLLSSGSSKPLPNKSDLFLNREFCSEISFISLGCQRLLL